jgi:hypothetical protein
MKSMRHLKQRGFRLSVDMQSFVRQVDTETGIIQFKDPPGKREIVSLADTVKLDVVEAELLTGTRNMEKAAQVVEEWGAIETILTSSGGALARHKGRTYFELRIDFPLLPGKQVRDSEELVIDGSSQNLMDINPEFLIAPFEFVLMHLSQQFVFVDRVHPWTSIIGILFENKV